MKYQPANSNEINFIITNKRNITKNAEVPNEVKFDKDHREARSEIKLRPRREINKFIRKPVRNIANLKIRATEFSLNIQHRYSILNDLLA